MKKRMGVLHPLVKTAPALPSSILGTSFSSVLREMIEILSAKCKHDLSVW